MKTNYKFIPALAIMLLAMLAQSCKTEKVFPQKEALKDISGDWQVIKATRNGSDLTSIVDFTQFRISFASGSYKLVNKLPFIVNQDGAYALDDPNYPFKITFTATGATPLATVFTYPIVNGKRQLNLTFSPGCTNNTYTYVLQKAN